MTDFNGWNMPLYYRGITEEHNHTRQAAGLFDLCHMGRVMIRGAGARAFVDSITPAHVRNAEIGEVQYSFLLDENGHTIDDITIYYFQQDLMLVVNAGNHDKDVAWLQKQAAGRADVTVEDVSKPMAMIAIQGPQAEEIVQKMCKGNFASPPYYHFIEKRLDGVPEPVIVSSTGYTGERGYEIYAPAQSIEKIWSDLLEAGSGVLMPIGLGARDSLRLEAAMPLYGHELTESTTPTAAGLNKFIDWEKPDFIGKQALLREKESGGPSRKLVGFEVTQRGPVARQGHIVCDETDKPIGEVASGIFSPTLQKTVGTAYVDSAIARVDTPLQIEIRGRKLPARIIKRPFYKRSS